MPRLRAFAIDGVDVVERDLHPPLLREGELRGVEELVVARAALRRRSSRGSSRRPPGASSSRPVPARTSRCPRARSRAGRPPRPAGPATFLTSHWASSVKSPAPPSVPGIRTRTWSADFAPNSWTVTSVVLRGPGRRRRRDRRDALGHGAGARRGGDRAQRRAPQARRRRRSAPPRLTLATWPRPRDACAP